MCQEVFDFGPVFRGDGEPDAVAGGAVGHDVVVAEGAFVVERLVYSGLRLRTEWWVLEGYAARRWGLEGAG